MSKHNIKCRDRLHTILDELLDHYNMTGKGLLTVVFPINQGSARKPQVRFENELGVETRIDDVRVTVSRTERLV